MSLMFVPFCYPVSLVLLYYFFFLGFNLICDIHITFFYTDTVPKLVVTVGGPFLPVSVSV